MIFSKDEENRHVFRPYRWDYLGAVFCTICHVAISLCLFIIATTDYHYWALFFPVAFVTWMIPAWYFWRASLQIVFTHEGISICYGMKAKCYFPFSFFSDVCVVEKHYIEKMSLEIPPVEYLCFYKKATPTSYCLKFMSLFTYNESQGYLIVPISSKEVSTVIALFGRSK